METGVSSSRGTGIFVRPLTFEAVIYCLRCEQRYVQTQSSRSHAEMLGMPLTADVSAWRSYLARLGWTGGGTICLECSAKPTTHQAAPR